MQEIDEPDHECDELPDRLSIDMTDDTQRDDRSDGGKDAGPMQHVSPALGAVTLSVQAAIA